MSDFYDHVARDIRDDWIDEAAPLRLEGERNEGLASLAKYLREKFMCDVCAGSGKDMKGEVCGCGGSGDVFGLVDGLRAELFRTREAKTELERMLEERRHLGPTREEANAAARACGFESIEGFFSALERRR